MSGLTPEEGLILVRFALERLCSESMVTVVVVLLA